MKVILLQELKGRGGEGDVINVADGFANNYLYPQGIAIPATKGNLKQLEQRRHKIAQREETRVSTAEGMKATLDSATVKVAAKVGDEGQLFGSVTAVMIADAIKNDLGIEVDRKRIDVKSPIKTAGEHVVSISLYREIKAELKVLVGEESDLAAAEEPAAEEAVAEEAAPEAEEAAEEEAADEQ